MPSKNNRELATRKYVWEITNFGSLALLIDTEHLLIVNFRHKLRMWKFHIYPKGKSNEDYISFYIFKSHISNQAVYNCTLSIGRPDKTPVKSIKYTGVRFMDNGVGEDFFLCKKYNSWIFKGPVRFRCDITEIDQKNLDLTHGACFNLIDTENLSRDLEELLKIPFNSDLTVSLNGNETYIHKYILKVRCPFLKFGYNSVMDLPSNVETDIDDEIFELLMHYIYTGKLKDSYAPLELLRLAKRLSLASFMHCLHEQACSYQTYSKADVENKVINWDLDELNFLEQGSTFVHILSTLYTNYLAIQVSLSDDYGKGKFIDISFKFFNVPYFKPISLISKVSLTSQSGLEVFKEAYHVFRREEQWSFPSIPFQKDEYMYIPGMCLSVDLSISNGSNSRVVRHIKTKTKLFTNFQTVTDNLENLSMSMSFLYKTIRSTSNVILLSSDNNYFRVHDGIMWARWPGFRKLIDRSPDSSNDEFNYFETPIELDLPSEVLNILLPYLYSGYIANFDRDKAELLLKHNSFLEYPYPLLKACKAVLSNDSGNQC